MRHPDPRAALTDEVARFQAEIRRLALAAAHEILRQELDRRLTRLAAPARRRALLAQSTSATPASPASAAPVAGPGPRPAARAPVAAAPEPARELAATQTGDGPNGGSEGRAEGRADGRIEGRADGRIEGRAEGRAEARIEGRAEGGRGKRSPWTREAIIEELASWMASGTAIDAAFVARHGPPGLVAATRRIFGRFDAALNVAGLHFSKLYPDGPPSRGTP